MAAHVLIVGGGPVGLLTALGFAKRGIRVTVIEAESKPNDSPRALVYHCSVLPHLRDLGILEDCVAAGFWRQDFVWRVHSSGEMIRWSMDCLNDVVEFPYALHLGQDKLSLIAEAHLRRFSHADIRYSTKLVGCRETSNELIAQVSAGQGDSEIRADWMVGADGANSFVRKHVLQMQFFGITWPERYVATNTHFDFDRLSYGKTTMQVDQRYGSVICKIETPDLWRVTFTESSELPEEGLQDRMVETFGTLFPNEGDYRVIACSPYRMHQRVADRMYRGRVLLAGDAAHVTNPTGGLGLTGGMFDSFALVEALSCVIETSCGTELLEDYDRERRRVFIEVVSPRASENLRNLYHLLPGQQRDNWIQNARQVASDRDRMRSALLFHENMRTVLTH